jgi:hypothetical protein
VTRNLTLPSLVLASHDWCARSIGEWWIGGNVPNSSLKSLSLCPVSTTKSIWTSLEFNPVLRVAKAVDYHLMCGAPRRLTLRWTETKAVRGSVMVMDDTSTLAVEEYRFYSDTSKAVLFRGMTWWAWSRATLNGHLQAIGRRRSCGISCTASRQNKACCLPSALYSY